MPKFYLTTPIYYVNAKPHIGHAYTTIAADVIARYKRSTHDVFFLTGTDEHGAHIDEAARRFGGQNYKDPKQFCDEMALLFKDAWKKLNIAYSHFIRTTDLHHEEGARIFIKTLKDKGALYEGTYTGLYCNNCEKFITKKELDQNGHCPDHKKPPEQISEKNWFFRLQTYLPAIKELIENNTLQIAPETKKAEVLGLFAQGLSDFSISRPNVRWGIPLPWDSSQTMYVWVEALLNYWTSLHSYPEWKKGNDDIFPPNLQLMAKDIIKFHCIYWPAMLLAYYDEDTSKLPEKIFAHGFFTINGQKMSKTLGNVIDPNDLARDYGADGARYLILSQFPFGADGDIEESKFKEKYNADLANGIGNLVSRISTACIRQIKDWDLFWQIVQKRYEENITNKEYDTIMDTCQLYETLRYAIYNMGKKSGESRTRAQNCEAVVKNPQGSDIGEVLTSDTSIAATDLYLAMHSPWKKDTGSQQYEIVREWSTATANLLITANQIKPFLPQTAEEIARRFDIKNKYITIGTPLFPRKV